MLQQRSKILHATTMTWCSQINKLKKKNKTPHILCNFIYVKYMEKINPQRQEIDCIP